jgi:hypothetical protein
LRTWETCLDHTVEERSENRKERKEIKNGEEHLEGDSVGGNDGSRVGAVVSPGSDFTDATSQAVKV